MTGEMIDLTDPERGAGEGMHGSSTATCYRDDAQQLRINIGYSRRRPVVVLDVGTFMIMVDASEITDHRVIEVLGDDANAPWRNHDPVLTQATPGDRRAAAEAAFLAGEMVLAHRLDPAVLADHVITCVVRRLGRELADEDVGLARFTQIMKIISDAHQRIEADAIAEGMRAAKTQLRMWLGLDTSGCVCGENP